MKEIVLIEDSPEDARAIRSVLQPLDTEDEILCSHISSLEASRHYFLTHCPDLVIMDLEFTKENTTSLSILSETLSNVPVIILSHLSHYQYSLVQQVDVKSFVRKENMAFYLLPAVREVLFPKEPAEPSLVTFPSPILRGVDESVPVSTIRFIEKIGRKEYAVYRTDGKVMHILSIGFAELCSSIARQNITTLQPANRSLIINISCIREIRRQGKGRIEFSLINLPGRTFLVGAKYERYFIDHFLLYA